MKKIAFSLVLVLLLASLAFASNMTVLICPQYMGGYDYSGGNIISTAFFVKISGLQPLTAYRFAAGAISGEDIGDINNNCYGYGYYYLPGYDVGYKKSPGYNNPATVNYRLPTSTNVATNGEGEVTFWIAISPNDNANFALCPLHLCVVHNRGDGTDTVDISGRLVSSATINPVTNFEGYPTDYDCAFIEGHSYAPGGKYIFLYDKEDPTIDDRPLHGYALEDNIIDESSGYGSAPAFYNSNVNTQSGRYGLIYPLINTSGIRCIRVINVDGSLYSVATDSDGIWPSGLNTTNLTKGQVYIMSSDAPLPVELETFTATLHSNLVVLNWQTATEVNVYAFEVQKKTSGQDWITIGNVFAHGNSNSPKYYSFKDGSLISGESYYRLKMIDNDGSFEYSPETSVTVGLPKSLIITQNYPNPFNPTTTINYSLPQNSFVALKVYDILGEEIAVLVNGEKPAGNYSVDFDGGNLASGTYIYKLSANGQYSVKKMILIK